MISPYYKEDFESMCECQYTVKLTDRIAEGFSKMKDNGNQVPSIHEVVEEDTDEENDKCVHRKFHDENANTSRIEQEISNGVQDDENMYMGESFCSETSSDESDIENVASEDTDNSSIVQIADFGRPASTMHDTELSRSRIQNREWDEFTDDDISTFPLHHSKSKISGNTFGTLRNTRNTRKNMTFTNEEIRTIERNNQLLLQKIMAQQKSRERIAPETSSNTRTCSSAINRKKFQKKVEYDNMLLLQRIQQAKSRVMNATKKSGCRLTFV